MYQDEFVERLIKLRTEKGVSARDMSLSIGQNPGYINTIENGKALPSMSVFFYICDYLKISPCEFFHEDRAYSEKYAELINNLDKISSADRLLISELVKRLASK